MKQQFKRILSVFLIFAMIVSFFPMQIKAADLEEDLPADDSSQEVEAIEPEQDAADSVDVQRGNVAFTTLSGTVVDASGNGMQGGSVVLYNYDENMLLPQCFTDSNGAWSSVEFDVLVGYTYLMSFYKAGYRFSANNFEVIAADGGTTVQTVTATALNIPGLVCKEGDYTYTISSEKATITKYTGSDTAIILPEKLGGYPVTAIGENAFKDNKTLQTVLCSGAITTLGEYAFAGCVSLVTVTLPNILYCSGSPELKAFTMKYSGNTYDVLKLGTAKPAVTFTPGTAFSFDAKFSNAEKSTRFMSAAPEATSQSG